MRRYKKAVMHQQELAVQEMQQTIMAQQQAIMAEVILQQQHDAVQRSVLHQTHETMQAQVENQQEAGADPRPLLSSTSAEFLHKGHSKCPLLGST